VHVDKEKSNLRCRAARRCGAPHLKLPLFAPRRHSPSSGNSETTHPLFLPERVRRKVTRGSVSYHNLTPCVLTLPAVHALKSPGDNDELMYWRGVWSDSRSDNGSCALTLAPSITRSSCRNSSTSSIASSPTSFSTTSTSSSSHVLPCPPPMSSSHESRSACDTASSDSSAETQRHGKKVSKFVF